MAWSCPRVVAALIGSAAMACSGEGSSSNPTGPSAPSTIHLTGRVVDDRTLQGMPGVMLLWGGGRAGLQQLPSVTDASGSYDVQLPAQDAYSVAGDRVFPGSTVRPIGAFDIINFHVNMGGCPTQYGRVVDGSARRPVAGAVVNWAGVTSTTDAAGHYRLTFECRPGRYGTGESTISVSHPNYQPYEIRASNAETLGVSAADVRFDIGVTPR